MVVEIGGRQQEGKVMRWKGPADVYYLRVVRVNEGLVGVFVNGAVNRWDARKAGCWNCVVGIGIWARNWSRATTANHNNNNKKASRQSKVRQDRAGTKWQIEAKNGGTV